MSRPALSTVVAAAVFVAASALYLSIDQNNDRPAPMAPTTTIVVVTATSAP